ncbi:putative Kinase [Melia azedarach]|uniref:Kinase n=1 Tax=Melia azedarach TaxID=155640 RepID=A0ACC1XUY3_MELAZ|nr:putative Kinase [Melia azedarach]
MKLRRLTGRPSLILPAMASLINELRSLFFVCCLVFLPSGISIHFKFSRFDPNTENIVYQGDAKAEPTSGTVELIRLVTYLSRVGWVTYGDKVPLWDSDTGTLSDFSTQFSFTIDTLGNSAYGHGLAFFLAPVGFQVPWNSPGGFLGLFNTSTARSSSNRIVLVEFDLFSNTQWDPSDVQDHVGINNCSITSSVYTRWNASFHSGDTAHVQINYNATTKNFSVSWSYEKTFNSHENTSLFYIIDLMKALPQWVTIGFSASTGQHAARHTLRSWEFNSSLVMKDPNGMKERKTKIIISAVLGVLVAGVLMGLAVLLKRKQKQKRKSTETAKNQDLAIDVGPRRFSYRDLASATNYFSEERKLGQGGFGAVYRGYLIDLDMDVAVKRISKRSKQGEKEYITEVKTCSQLRHRNLLQLLGWCHDRGEFLLVYELMPNGSLDSHVFRKNSNPLTWPARYKISVDLASSLLYLHEEWKICVVHRDIKSSNVMLDSDFNAKLGDFGLARLMDHELGPRTTGLAGTLGYMAPEYISTGRASKESDVFSFGVVALEIATGRRSTDYIKENPEIGLVEWVWDLYGKGKLTYGADERLNMGFDEQQMECLMIVGLWCAHPNRDCRPSIRQALQVLKVETAFPDLPPKMPVPIFLTTYNYNFSEFK